MNGVPRPRFATLAALALTLLAGGCSWFGGDKEDKIVPAPLVDFEPSIELVKLWDKRLGKAAEDKVARLTPMISGSRLFAVSADGKLHALDVASGRQIWSVDVRDQYEDAGRLFGGDDLDLVSGGVGIGKDLVAIATTVGEVLTYRQSDGSFVWRAATSSEVLAPPRLNDDVVVVQSIDGKLAGYDVLDGERKWLFSIASVPSLTLRGTATPLVSPDFVVSGFANGHIVLLDPVQGLPRVDTRVAVSQGKSDLERLIDVDGPIVLEGTRLFAASYQGNLLAVDLPEGTPAWREEASSTAGLAEGFGNIYLVETDSTIIAFDRNNGDDEWRNDRLLNRELGSPATVSSYLAVGDFEGYLHLLAQSDGRFVARRRVDSERLRGAPLVDGARLYIQGSSGRLTALEIR